MMTPLRARLRQATAPAHHRVDARMGAWDLATRAGYGRFLLAQDGALGPVERALEAGGMATILADWPARSRRAALARDLVTLDLRPLGPVPLAPPASVAALWGMAYVLEGSRLGARMLLPRVLAGPDPRCRAATAHLRHGEGQPLWQGFLAALEASPEAQADPDAMLAGAVAAFGAFERSATNAHEDSLEYQCP